MRLNMRLNMLLTSLFLFAPHAFAEDKNLVCNYLFYDVPLAKVEFSIDSEGTPSAGAMVTIGTAGQARKEPLTPQTPAPDEFLHLWIAKNEPGNTLEMIIYKEKKELGRSILINPGTTIGRELWGDCEGLQ